MRIGGFKRFSVADYPGKHCAIVFTQGCNFRCSYCHNPELVDESSYGNLIPVEDVLSFLETRKSKLDAVVVTGGEPTLQPDLFDFLKKVKKMGFLIKVDTNGSRPDVIGKLVESNLVDYIAMDAKGPLGRYREITRSNIDTARIGESMGLIMKSGKAYEFRTTVVNTQLTEKDLIAIGKTIKGASSYVLQPFVASKTLDPAFNVMTSYPPKKLLDLRDAIRSLGGRCEVR
ncbi:MAG: anaerobic ribonucleoside-triphosphate reductase activating protein [Candidatus Thermoplasmatota archaeon]|jgi:pyruvate formate lyase activating enzyme|nr:anaerobic ribonucleoside-triphosphate reductase activating protein [Candidatus Thermoplasmatota archaeon]